MKELEIIVKNETKTISLHNSDKVTVTVANGHYTLNIRSNILGSLQPVYDLILNATKITYKHDNYYSQPFVRSDNDSVTFSFVDEDTSNPIEVIDVFFATKGSN